MSDLSGYSLDISLNQNSSEGSTRAPLPFSNGRQEYHNIAAIRGSEAPGGHLVEISQCYMLQFGSFTFCLHPPAGLTLDSLPSLVSALQQQAPIYSFGPDLGRWPAAQNVSSVSNSGVLILDQNPTSAPQCAMLSAPTYISNPGVQLSVPSPGVLIPDQNPTSAPQCAMLSAPTYISNPGVQLPVPSPGVLIPDRNPTSAPQCAMLSAPTYISDSGVLLPVPSTVSGPRTNQPVFNPPFVQYPVRQLHVPNSSFIPNPSVATNSNRTVFLNSSLPPPTYPSFLHNASMPPTPNSYVVPNSIMQPPAPNPSYLHYQISNPTPPVQPVPTIQSDIMSQSSNWTSLSSSYPRHVSNGQYMPYSGSVPQHHPSNLNLNGGPRNETVILNPSPPQAANFPARNDYPPAPQPNYYNQGPGYLYSNPTDSTVIITAQNSYPSYFITNPSEQNPNPHLL